jgi:hypothetical protein
MVTTARRLAPFRVKRYEKGHYTVDSEFRRYTASRAWINRLRVESAVVDDRFSCGSAREPESESII